ncbi:MAG: preprotein translocase subunit SecG [Alphaproteobacteria bacterium]
MENILLVVHLMIAIALVAVVLLQRSEGGALGMGGGSAGGGMGMFSARGAANALTRTTAILAVCFILTSLGLAILSGSARESESILDSAPEQLEEVFEEETDPGAVPTTE